MRSALGAILCVAAVPGGAQTPVPPPLTAQGSWKVDYAETECRLTRTFGSGADQVDLTFARGAGLKTFNVTVAGPSVARPPGRFRLSVDLARAGEVTEFDAVSVEQAGGAGASVKWFGQDLRWLDLVQDRDVLTLRLASRLNVALDLTSMRAARNALDTCHINLLKGWGLDPVTLLAGPGAPRPLGNPGEWATDLDYPSAARRKGQMGDVYFVLAVGSDGRVRECRVAQSSGTPDLDVKACELMVLRGRFKPAEDADGKAVPGYYMSGVHWTLPAR